MTGRMRRLPLPTVPRLRLRVVDLWDRDGLELTDTPRPKCRHCYGNDPAGACHCWNPRLSLRIWVESPQRIHAAVAEPARAPRLAALARAVAARLSTRPKSADS